MIRRLIGSTLIVLVIACSTPPSGQFMADAQLAITMLRSISTVVAADPKASASTINDINAAISTMQTALNDVQSGTKKPSDYAKLAKDVIDGLKGPLGLALGANPEVMLGIDLAEGLLPILAADLDATQAPKVTASSARARAAAWAGRH